MLLTWYGHAAFLLEGGTPPVRVVFDPYRAPDVGDYAPINDWADVVAFSHENAKYHSYTEGISGRAENTSPISLNGLSLFDRPQTVDGVLFSAVRVWDDETRRDPIAMVIAEINGLRVLHMGDCGHALSSEQIAACGRVDVLLALAGGPPTLALPDVADFICALAPRVVVPMHFGNDKINLNLRPVDDFLSLFPSDTVRPFDRPTVDVSDAALPPPGHAPQIWVLPSAR